MSFILVVYKHNAESNEERLCYVIMKADVQKVLLNCVVSLSDNCIPLSFWLWFWGKGHKKRKLHEGWKAEPKKPWFSSLYCQETTMHGNLVGLTYSTVFWVLLWPSLTASTKLMVAVSFFIGSMLYRLLLGLPHHGPSLVFKFTQILAFSCSSLMSIRPHFPALSPSNLSIRHPLHPLSLS